MLCHRCLSFQAGYGVSHAWARPAPPSWFDCGGLNYSVRALRPTASNFPILTVLFSVFSVVSFSDLAYVSRGYFLTFPNCMNGQVGGESLVSESDQLGPGGDEPVSVDVGSTLWQWNPGQDVAPSFLHSPSFGVDTGFFGDLPDVNTGGLDSGIFGDYVEPVFDDFSDQHPDRSAQSDGRDDRGVDHASLGAESQCDELTGSSSKHPVVTADVHHAIFSRGLLSNCDSTGITLPWETDFYRELFSDDAAFDSLVPKVPISGMVDLEPVADPQHIVESLAGVADFSQFQPVFASHVSCVDDVNFLDRRETLRTAAIWKLLVVIRHCLPASSTGRHILALGSDAAQSPEGIEIVSAVVGVKSPATLMKRANALLSFLRWVDKEGHHVENAFEESVVWMYLSHLKEISAAPTRGATMMSALRFARFVLGFDSLEAAVASRRLLGISDTMMASKRLLRQSLVLTVTQVTGLHSALRSSSLHCMDKAVVAYLLIALFGRCRHSDLQFVSSLECDYSHEGGYILIQTCCHKTGRMAALKSRLLPIMIPARGVDGSLWAEDAMKALFDAGVELTAPINGPPLESTNRWCRQFYG